MFKRELCLNCYVILILFIISVFPKVLLASNHIQLNQTTDTSTLTTKQLKTKIAQEEQIIKNLLIKYTILHPDLRIHQSNIKVYKEKLNLMKPEPITTNKTKTLNPRPLAAKEKSISIPIQKRTNESLPIMSLH
ncbi:MAG: hypothetical protein HQL46_14065 [Gammaproteobacteria bacterium]|nr:hypothetical protein [Gammaproteobacteria bacterium]